MLEGLATQKIDRQFFSLRNRYDPKRQQKLDRS